MPRFLKSSMFATIVLFSSTLFSTPLAPKNAVEHRAVVNVRFDAGFLAPGLHGSRRRNRSEVLFSPIEWTGPLSGKVVASLWKTRAQVLFELNSDRTIAKVLIQPLSLGGRGLGLDVWRHRHGYVYYPHTGYVWNSLDDQKPDLDENLGKMYDRFLEQVWEYWIAEKLPWLLDGKLQAATGSPAMESGAEFPVSVIIKNAALEKVSPVVFQIHVWDVPVKVVYRFHPPGADVDRNGAGVGKYTWKYDMGELRRRHGYRHDFLFGYKWVAGFPSDSAMTEEKGQLLDQLLTKTVDYWVEVSVEQVVADFQLRVSRLAEDHVAASN